MTLEQIIRYAITGILLSGVETASEIDMDIQELINILIDYGSITDERLTDLLKK